MPELAPPPADPTAAAPRRGRLRIYLGAAPGVGKTYATLREGRRLADGGVDVVVGIAETHGRPETEALLDALPRIPPRRVSYRDATFAEIDLDAILRAHPAVVLIDELAHSNTPGSRHAKRWQDVETLLDRGIDVVSNLNVQHLSSLADEAASRTGGVDPETVPDDFVGSADRIELVDVDADTLHARLESGGLYGPEQSTLAREQFFRADRLVALRELADDWLAQRDRDGADRECVDGSPRVATRRAPVVVSLTGAPDGERVVRRAAEIAAHARAALVGVHVREPTGLVQAESARLVRQREVLVEAGGRYAEVGGVDEATTILEFVHAEAADHLVIGVTRHSLWTELRRSSVVHRALRNAPSTASGGGPGRNRS